MVACSAGCGGPALDVPRAQLAEHSLELEPEAELSRAPAAFRGRLPAASAGEPWLFHDTLSDYQDRALRRGELSASLLERALPLRYWREGADLLFQPSVWLEPGETYSVALTGQGRVAEVVVANDSGEPRAERYFPAAVASESTAVLCGAHFGLLPESTLLEPGDTPVRVSPGIFDVPREDCITLRADHAPREPAVLPASLGGVLLEPGLFREASPAPSPAPACLQGDVVAGACLEVEDDRVLLSSTGRASLWLLDEPVRAQLSLAPFARTTLLAGLNAASSYALAGRVVFSSGERVELAQPFVTGQSRRHLVISEVLANAVGPEPASEWIELVNDGSQPASLAGVWLEDASGNVPLPAVELLPGEVALLVSTGYRSSGLDVAVPAETRLVELSSLGTRGLSNSGEPLVLVGSEGVLSRFPALASPHAGRSVARRALTAPDDDPVAFAEHGAPGASPGTANTFD